MTRIRRSWSNRGAQEYAWSDAYRKDIGATYLSCIGYEAGAAFITNFPGEVVPGLLQTREYAEALTEQTVEPARVGSVVRLRLERQTELAKRSSPPRQYHVLDEAVIRRHLGIRKDPAIMPDQLRRMADRAEQDELVTVRVIPFKAEQLLHRSAHMPPSQIQRVLPWASLENCPR